MNLPPLIITLEMQPNIAEYFTSLRTKYFPAHVNYLSAHITLFHKLPAANENITKALREHSKRCAMPIEVSAVRNIGNGVAFMIESEELSTVHAALQKEFDPYLIWQDRQILKPHITVQNKVTAFKAAETFKMVQADFEPFDIEAVGFSTWLYLKGPWEKKDFFCFSM